MARRDLTREQALQWRAWSFTDKERIEAEIDRLSIHRFEVDANQLIRCYGVGDALALFLYPGYVMFARGFAPAEHPRGTWPGFILSTFKPWMGSRQPDPAPQQTCPIHGTVLPLTGICDDCEG